MLAAAFLLIIICGFAFLYENALQEKDVLFQTSTINALSEGVYDGEITYGELKKHGDVGIGTFNDLDGEMIELDGNFYQIKADGIVYLVDDSMRTPFAVVTFFEPDKTLLLDKSMDYQQFSTNEKHLLRHQNRRGF